MRRLTMAQLGDRVKVSFSGVVLSGAIDSTSAKADAPVTIYGKIVEDLEDSWLVSLEISVEGKNQVVIPKDTEAAKRD